MYLPRGRKLIPIEEFITSRSMEVATKFVQPFIPTLLSLILTSLSLPHDPLRFPPSSNNSPTLSPFLRLPPEVTRKNFRFPPFFPSLSLPLRTSSRCASFLPTVGKLALTRLRKNAINERRGSKASLEEFPVEKGDAAEDRESRDPEIYCGNGAIYVGVHVDGASLYHLFSRLSYSTFS